MRKERHEFDYDYNGQFLFHIGHIQYRKAHPPMPIHEHRNMVEFVYLEKGQQTYQVQNETFVVNPGEVFFTKPNEVHSTGFAPEEISSFYYMIVNFSLLSELNTFVDVSEYEVLQTFFRTSERIYQAPEGLKASFDTLLKCFNNCDSIHFHTHVRNALSEVLLAATTSPQIKNNVGATHMERSLQYISEHLEERVLVSDLAEVENMSLSSYHKTFYKIMGISPAEYVLKLKVEKTKELLRETDLTVTEIAHQYGFSSSQYFSTVFKRFCYVTPSEYKKKK